jgi:phage repressor protein C with HTH and peptisase S24 domain
MSQPAFAALAGQTKQSQIRYENGVRSPNGHYFSAIRAHGADVPYILTGQRSIISEIAELRKGPDPRQPWLDAIADAIPPPRGAEDFVFVPRYEVDLSAGPGVFPAENAEADQLAFSRAWMRGRGLANQRCGLLRVEGDSMMPTIPNGALVLVHIAELPVDREAIFAFSRNSEGFVKRLVPVNVGSDGKATSLVILSDNPAYPPDVVVGDALNELRIIGRVHCIMVTV